MRIKKGLTIKDIAGERVLIIQGLVGADMTKIISFNASSEWLWKALSGKDFTEDNVAELLVEQYGIDRETAQTDADRWIKQLSDANLIES
jgi:hypothetical protein